MNRRYVAVVIVLWFSTFAFISFATWELGKESGLPAHLFQVATVTAFFFIMIFARRTKGRLPKNWVVDSYSNVDGFVVAKIDGFLFDMNKSKYIGSVKRNYQDRVFLKEEEFDDYNEAKAWLRMTYDEELSKHLELQRDKYNGSTKF